MKKVAVLFFALAVLFCMMIAAGTSAVSSAVFAQGVPSKDFRKTVDFEPGGNLTVKTDKGTVSLTSWDHNQVEIIARIEAPDDVSDDYGRRVVETARIEVLGDARALTIRSNFDDVPYKTNSLVNRERRLPDIHYEIRAPRRLNLDLDVDRCSKTEINGFAGSFDVTTDRSSFTANDLNGPLHLRVDRGTVRVTQLQGSLDVSTDRTDSRIEITALNENSKVGVGRGEMVLLIPESLGLNVKASVGRRERFDTDFPVLSTAFGKERVEGAINGGGPLLTISGDRSSVTLKRK